MCHAIGAVQDHARTQRYRRVGHDADDGIGSSGQLLDGGHGQAGRHSHQHEWGRSPGEGVGQLRQNPWHHLRLDAQKDQVAGLGDGLVVGDGCADFQSQCVRLGLGAVGEKYVVFAFGQSLCQCAAHVAAADETDGVELHTPFLQCDGNFSKGFPLV